MTAEKEYFAFISYQREDEKWAKWLADELEHYHLPTTLNGKDLPKNLRPIFRDVDELSAGNLPEQIYQALSISKNLIVICSPRSAKSEWVDKEIEDFIKIKGGKVDNIYPFIIEGIPFSKDVEKECYPEKLRNLPENEERLGGNINEQGGRNAAAVKIIAGMLGVGFDALWQKYEREKRRKRNMTLLGIISFAVVAFGIALWMWHLNNQVSTTNRKLVRENICINSREVINLLENGKYVDAKHQMQSILDLWHKEYQQNIPEMEKALRTLYRYQNRDGIVKLYSLPLSDKQQFLSADSDYLYIRDMNEGKDRIISYIIDTGDSARQVFPKEGQMIYFPIYDCRNGIVICKNIKQFYQDDDYRAHLDTVCIYDLKSGKKIIEKNGHLHAIILNKENVLLQHYDTLSKSLSLEVVQTNNGQVIQKLSSPFDAFFYAASLINDSLIVIGDSRTILYHVKSGKELCKVDYEKEINETDYLVNNSMINKSLKQFVIGSYLGLKLFSTEKHNIHILDRSDKYGPTAFNPSGTMLAAVKYGNERKKEKDSILVYVSGIQFPIFSIEGNGLGNITFADDNLFVEGYNHHNRINVYSCAASFDSRELYSQTGRYYAWLDRDDRDSIVIFNDSTEESVDVISNSEKRISWVYGFSPKDTYLLYSTTKHPLIVHHIPNKKDITIPISWNDVRNNSFDCYISDNERKLLRVIHSFMTKEDYIALYDIGKDVKEIFNIVVTQDQYHAICYALSANGSKMALTEGSKIYVYKTDSFPKGTTSIDIRHIDNSSVRNICFSKGDSQLLAASYSDGTIRFWDTMTGEQRYSTIYSEAKKLISLDISSDAQYLIGTSKSDYDNWEYLIWHIPSGLLIDRETDAWSWWANSIIRPLSHMKPVYRACFASNSNEIIVNEHNLLGLSRKFGFPTFDELIALYAKSLLSDK